MIMITLQYCCFYFGSVGGDLVTAGSVGGENVRASGARTVYVGEGPFDLPCLRLPLHPTLNGPVF